MIEFSIIMPVYNAERYIRQALDSIANQSYPNFEVIMVDDGSTDASGKICDEYAQRDARFRVIHQPNGGVTRARKVGIQHATKEYVTWVDADDYIGKDMLKKLNNIIEKYKPDMVAFAFTVVSNDGHFAFIKQNKLLSEKLYSTHVKGFFEGMIYERKESFGDGAGLNFELWDKAIKWEKLYDSLLAVPDELRIGEDMASVFTALQQCDTIYISKMCDYFYRMHDTSIMHTFKLDELKRHMILYDYLSKNRGKIPQENIDSYTFKEILGHVINAISQYEQYADYAKYLKEEMTPEVRAVINGTKIPRCTFKEFILLSMLKHYCYFGFWLVLHTRKKVISYVCKTFQGRLGKSKER